VLAEPPDGLPRSRLTSSQQGTLNELIEEYLAVLSEPIALTLRREIDDRREHTRFGWAGSRTEGQPHYYALLGPGLLIEYNNSGAHMHTILRTDNDFGAPGNSPTRQP